MTAAGVRSVMPVMVAGRQLQLSNPDKLYWPEDGITKGEFLTYCARIAPWLVPYLAKRPLVVTRYPNGINEPGFYQKNAPSHVPDWVPRHRVFGSDRHSVLDMLICNEPAALIWVAGTGAIEWHPFHARIPTLDHPDYVVVDLDPVAGAGFPAAVAVAQLLGELLRHLQVRGYVKTSGGSGLHVFIPIEPRYDYKFTADFARRLGAVLQFHAPELITLERAVKKRRGQLYFDYLQNGRQKTVVAVYCPRPRAGAPVSFPVGWSDLPYVAPEDFTIKTVPSKLDRGGDRMFQAVLRDRQLLDEAANRLDRLIAAMTEGD